MQLTELLAAQRKGCLLIEAQEKLREVVKACVTTGKPGSITIKLTIRQGDEDSVTISDSIVNSIPEKDKHPSSFFCDEEGELHRDNPKQGEFEVVKQAAEAQ